ncbi:MAG: OmpA family protein [Bacteroidetes bacterium]|nr:OmpA family protein [Bacteroidota bacterium]
MKLLSAILFFFLIAAHSYSQEANPYGIFSSKEAKKILKRARKDTDFGNFKDAEDKYVQLVKSDSANAVYNYELAVILYNNFDQIKSIPYFERAIKYSKDTIGEAFYFLASSYHLAKNFDSAEKNYRQYLSLVAKHGTTLWPDEEGELRNELLHKIEMCDNGRKLVKTPVEKITIHGKTHSFQIVNAGKNINTNFDDYDAVLTSDDSLMYFTSRREGTTGGKVDWDDKYFEDIYVSSKQNDAWSLASNLGAPINSDKHEAVISASADKKTIYFYKGVKQGTFYYSVKKNNNEWSNPEILNEKSDLNTKAWETSFFGFTLANNELYVVSDRAGGKGGRDIYLSKRQTDGTWGPLTNIGEPINSEFDEDAPFLTSDGKTMYFASSGHNSMGGFDIFKSERNGDKWSEPVNLGAPINTPGEDIFFTIANKSDRAFYSSNDNKPGGTCDMDIYMIDLCDDIPTTTISGLAMGISKGIVVVSDKATGKEVHSFEIKDGKYSGTIEHGKNYLFTLKTEGLEPAPVEVYIPRQCKRYDVYQELNFTKAGEPLAVKNAFFDIKTQANGMNYSEFLAKADKSKLSGYSEATVNTHPMMIVMVDTIKKVTATKDTATGKMKIDTATSIKTTIAFNNVLFDFNKSNLKKEFMPELDKAVALLKKNYPQVKFEVAGHTDSKGTEKYNLNLSKRRADAVVNYLASKGISRSRMKVAGYGATKPIASNSTEEGMAKNRRTEIVIIQ